MKPRVSEMQAQTYQGVTFVTAGYSVIPSCCLTHPPFLGVWNNHTVSLGSATGLNTNRTEYPILAL